MAEGGRLEGERPARNGHAVEARLNAEDAEQGFAPAPGRVELMRAAHRARRAGRHRLQRRRRHPAAVRLDDRQGHRLGPRPPRGAGAAARARCARPPSSCAGGTTTKSFLLDLLDRPEVVAGTADTGWLDRAGTVDGRRVGGRRLGGPGAGGHRRRRRRGGGGAGRVPGVGPRRPPARHARGRPDRRARPARAGVPADRRADRRRPVPGGARRPVRRRGAGPPRPAGEPARSSAAGAGRVVAVAGDRVAPGRGRRRHPPRDPGRGRRRARPGAGRRRRAAARPGDEVEAGQTVVVLESMKMETAVRAPFAGTGPRRPRPGQLAGRRGRGAADHRPGGRRGRGDDRGAGRSARARRRPRRRAPRDRGALAARRAAGADHRLRRERRVRPPAGVRVRRAPAASCGDADDELLQGELAVLTTFADLAELSRNRPARPRRKRATSRSTARASTSTPTCTRSTPSARSCPRASGRRLRRALRHYGVDDARASRDRSSRRPCTGSSWPSSACADQVPAVLALLDRWLSAADATAGPRASGGRRRPRPARRRHAAALSRGRRPRPRRCGSATSRSRSSGRTGEVVLDSAAAAAGRAEDAAARGDADESMRRVEALVESPEPLIRLLAERGRAADRRSRIPSSRC